jgi:HEAT repeat protein
METPTHAVLVGLIYGVAGTLLGLALLIVINKAWRELHETVDRRRRTALEPAVFEYARNGSGRTIRDVLPKPLSPRDGRRVQAILMDAARLVKGDARDRITTAFEELGCVQQCVRALRSRRWWGRAEAAEKLGLMRSAAAVEPLAAAMDDPIAEVRIRAAHALGVIRGRTSVRPLVRALADPNRWSAIRLAEILIGVGAEAVDELLTEFDGLPLHARLLALEVFGRVRTQKASGLLRRCLEDSQPDLRARAAHAMGLIGDPAFTADLNEALGDDAWSVRAMAAKALGRIGQPDAIPRLCEALADRQWWVRTNAGEALRALGPPGREALIRMLETDDVYARHQAVAQLEEGGIIDEYVADLVSTDPRKREAAVRFVERVISLQRVDRLTQQAIEHTQESVRQALMRILGQAPQEAS